MAYSQQDAQDELNSFVPPAPPPAKDAPPPDPLQKAKEPLPGPVTPSLLDTIISGVDKYTSHFGITRAMRDVSAGFTRGVVNTADAVKSGLESSGKGLAMAEDPEHAEDTAQAQDPFTPMYDHARSAAMAYRDMIAIKNPGPSDSLLEGAGQMIPSFLAFSRVVGSIRGLAELGASGGFAARTAGNVARFVPASTATDLTAQGPHDPRFADVLQLLTHSEGKFGDALRNLTPDGVQHYIDFLADKSGPEAENRFKNVLDGYGAGAVLTGLFSSAAGAFKQGWKALHFMADNNMGSMSDLMPKPQDGYIGTANPKPAAQVNVGLKVGENGSITREDALAALESTGAKVNAHNVANSTTEPTLTAQLDRPLTPEEAHAVSVKTQQEAIVQHVPGGESGLYGPNAKAWGDFNPKYFLDINGQPLSNAPVAQPVGADLATTSEATLKPEDKNVHAGPTPTGEGLSLEGEKGAQPKSSAQGAPSGSVPKILAARQNSRVDDSIGSIAKHLADQPITPQKGGKPGDVNVPATKPGYVTKLVKGVADELDASTERGAFYKAIFSQIGEKDLSKLRLVPHDSPNHKFDFQTWGSYNPISATIALNPLLANMGDALHTFAHELTHAVEWHAIDANPILQEHLRNIAADLQASPAGSGLRGSDKYIFGQEPQMGRTGPTLDYVAHEVSAEARSNPRVQAAMKATPSRTPGQSLWDEYKEFVGKIMGIAPPMIASPYMDELLTEKKGPKQEKNSA